jgi:hypothetical protein
VIAGLLSRQAIAANLFVLVFGVMLTNCSLASKKNNGNTSINAGDAEALALALRVEDAVGGKENWDKVPIISFNFFGSRLWYWDKLHNRYRVESEKKKYRIAGTLDGKETLLWLHGNQVTSPDSITKYKALAYDDWINDTYWLILPFKLTDPNVHLTYLGVCQADSLSSATCLEITFNDVGVTPDNKYKIYIDNMSDLIIRWDYYENKNDTIPSLSSDWSDYKSYGSIKLAGGRGDRSLTGINVFDTLPEKIFTDVLLSSVEIMKEASK